MRDAQKCRAWPNRGEARPGRTRTLRSTRVAVGLMLIVGFGTTGSLALSGTMAAAAGRPAAGSTSIPTTLAGADHLQALAHPMNGLTPLSQAAPHGHPLAPVGGLSPHTVMGGPESLSSNWSGAIEDGSGGAFTGVEGSWVVPRVQGSAADEASATWVGIDGVDASSLIQTGTLQNSGPDYGGTQYDAWVELLPGALEVIGNSSGPATVDPGDTMTASIVEDSPGLWTIDLNNTTQSWSFSEQFAYSTPGSTAEWIEEAPTVNGSVATLADYGSTTFSGLGVTGTGLSSVGTVPVYLASPTGAIISYPADFSGDSFSMFYGSPSPQVTSVNSNQGSTSGGTSVTIGGTFLTGVNSVDFGGVAVPFSVDPYNGTVTALSPPHAAGTVDVTVTTAGGTSQRSSADQFTYVAPAQQSPPNPSAQHGYWLVGSDGGIFTFGSAQFFGSTGSLHLQRPVVGMVPTTDRGGYWLDASDGGIFAFGDSGFYGSIPGLGLHPAGSGSPNSLNAPIVGMVPSADGHGYFMVAADGGVFAFGDATFAGSCPGIGGCSGAAVAVMPDASGGGYWLVTQTGNVYTFGNALYEGAPGNVGSPVTSAVRTPDGNGYWVLLANGTVYAYGDAANFGSPAGQLGGQNPASAIFSTSDGGGYWIASAQGAVDTYGDAPFDGSMAGTHLNGSIIAGTGF
jgi:peptidase A4-like protein/IPT/TIG domain-containing protein